MLNAEGSKPDAMTVVDLDPESRIYAGIDMPNTGDELHHFG